MYVPSTCPPPHHTPPANTKTVELIYWPGMPGRGEYIRLLFEASGTAYTDKTDAKQVVQLISPGTTTTAHSGGIPPFAPPILRHGANTLFQTPAIVGYLAPLLGLAPLGFAQHQMNALVLTALDFCDEVHNTHHPVSVSLYYEDQVVEAKRCAAIFRKERVPKFFGYFERVLAAGGEGGGGWLIGGKISAADLVLWQVVDGVKYAFPKAAGRVMKDMPQLKAHYERVKEGVKEYLASDRRRGYSTGLFRQYPELDDQEGEE